MKKISIIVPIYKEKDNIIELTDKIRKNLKSIKYEIIFVDDDSDDGTKEILKKLKKKYRYFDFIIRKKKKDLTQSCFIGIEKSKYKSILITMMNLIRLKRLELMFIQFVFKSLFLFSRKKKMTSCPK